MDGMVVVRLVASVSQGLLEGQWVETTDDAGRSKNAMMITVRGRDEGLQVRQVRLHAPEGR